MEIVLDLTCFIIVVWCIVIYVRNTNKVISELIKQLEEKKKNEK